MTQRLLPLGVLLGTVALTLSFSHTLLDPGAPPAVGVAPAATPSPAGPAAAAPAASPAAAVLPAPQHPNWPPADYALFYGTWTPEIVQKALDLDLLVVHPGADFKNLTRDLITQLKNGRDAQAGTEDDVVVLGYVSIGEDEKPPAGPPPEPRPEGPVANLNGLQPTAGGYPTRYLDELAYSFAPDGERRYGDNGKPLISKGHDKIPDENGVWGSYYVNAADPEWQQACLAQMQKLQDDLGVDGFFLDTLDTASPWGDYGFTRPQLASTLRKIRQTFPQRLIVGNRGMSLLETDPEAYESSLDGVLYETIYAIWDWGASAGVVSPWARPDYKYLQSPVLPSARKPGGFHMFYVNYLNPKQPNFYPMLHCIEDLVGREGVSNYVGDPLLQTLQPPLSELFPLQGEAPPVLGNLSLSEQPRGGFALQAELTGLQGRKLGDDLFLDVRVSKEEPATSAEIALLDEVYVDHAALPAPAGDVWKGTVNGLGLEPATTYHFYARAVGKTRECRTSYLHVSFTTAQRRGPAGVTELKAEPLESSVRLTWTGNAAGYKIYQGTTPNNLQPVASAQKSPYVVAGLKNGETHYFSVLAVDAANVEGSLVRPVLCRAEDCTAGPAPASVQARVENKTVKLSWAAAAEPGIVYKVYCVPAGENYRIPLRVGSQTEATIADVPPGKYSTWVTAVDGSGNESRRAQVVPVEVK